MVAGVLSLGMVANALQRGELIRMHVAHAREAHMGTGHTQRKQPQRLGCLSCVYVFLLPCFIVFLCRGPKLFLC